MQSKQLTQKVCQWVVQCEEVQGLTEDGLGWHDYGFLNVVF